jgi:hypothetical protein
MPACTAPPLGASKYHHHPPFPLLNPNLNRNPHPSSGPDGVRLGSGLRGLQITPCGSVVKEFIPSVFRPESVWGKSRARGEGDVSHQFRSGTVGHDGRRPALTCVLSPRRGERITRHSRLHQRGKCSPGFVDPQQMDDHADSGRNTDSIRQSSLPIRAPSCHSCPPGPPSVWIRVDPWLKNSSPPCSAPNLCGASRGPGVREVVAHQFRLRRRGRSCAVIVPRGELAARPAQARLRFFRISVVARDLLSV